MNPLLNRLTQAFGMPTAAPDTSTDVAHAVVEFARRQWGNDADSATVLEGLWLGMQLLAGPSMAARVLRDCAPTGE